MNLLSPQQMLEQNVNRVVQEELKKSLEILKKQLPAIQIQLRQEIFQAFKLITGIIIEQEFVKVYGDSFELNSLQNSLIYIPSGNSLDIDISYNPKIFRFKSSALQNQEAFNKNARRWERKNRRYLTPGFYTDSGSFADFYETGDFEDYTNFEDDDDDDYMDELLMDYDDMTFNRKRNPTQLRNVRGTYDNAIAQAKSGFNREWQRSLKNRLEKKYGIKLTD